jgi:hypothetical protein
MTEKKETERKRKITKELGSSEGRQGRHKRQKEENERIERN